MKKSVGRWHFHKDIHLVPGNANVGFYRRSIQESVYVGTLKFQQIAFLSCRIH